MSALHLSRATDIFVVDCCQFGQSWIFGLKMELIACAGWGVMQTFWRYFISLILSFKVRKKKALLRCTVNQAGTGHKLHLQPKNPARAKLAVINSKNGCGTAEVWCRQFVSISKAFILSYKVRKKRCCFFPCMIEHTIHHMIDFCVLVCLLFPPEEPLQSPNISPAVRPCLHVLQFLWRFFSRIPS